MRKCFATTDTDLTGALRETRRDETNRERERGEPNERGREKKKKAEEEGVNSPVAGERK
jgi:hypothetical protein